MKSSKKMQGIVSKAFTDSSPAQSVRRVDLARMLHWLRVNRNESLETIGMHLRLALKQGEQHALGSAKTQIAREIMERGIDAVEGSDEGLVEIEYADVRLLANAYGVHRLLLDPLFSAPDDGVCTIQHFQDFLLVGDDSEQSYGKLAAYRTPRHRLSGMEATAIVHLTIEPGGRSDTHWHSGDELMFVLRGKVDVLLRNCGLRARVNERDYIHFHAEQEHCAFNATDEPAEIFILRIRPSQRRANALLTRSRKADRPARASTYIEHGIRLGQYSRLSDEQTPTAGRNLDREVFDRAGLAWFLQMLRSDESCGPGGPLTFDELARRGKRACLNRTRLYRIHQGGTPVFESDLLELAHLYGVEALLFYDFLTPVIRDAIVVRQRGDTQLQPGDPGDFLGIPADSVNICEAIYRIPCRRLADSDIAVAWVQLPPGASTPVNQHPGHEILLPLAGCFEIQFGEMAARLTADREFACFQSYRRHQVVNTGNLTAEFLVIRAYG